MDSEGNGGRDDQRAQWERQRRRLRVAQDVGLALLALGVLVLVYLALTYSPGS